MVGFTGKIDNRIGSSFEEFPLINLKEISKDKAGKCRERSVTADQTDFVATSCFFCGFQVD